LRVRILPETWKSVYCECCVLSGRSLLQRNPTDCGVSEFDFEISKMMSPGPIRAVEPYEKNKK